MKRNLSIDILKLVLAFLVVGLHVRIFKDVDSSLSYFFVQGVTRIGVPLFLIIGGFYFYNIETKTQFVNWIKRLLYMYLIWMTVYVIFWKDYSFANILFRLIFGYHHLWYLVGALYGFIIAWAMRNFKLKTQLLLVVLSTVIGLFLQDNNNYSITSYNFESPEKLEYVNVYRNGLFFCFPFIMIGYLINKYSINKKQVNWLVLTIAGFCLLAVEVIFNYKHGAKVFDMLLSLYILCPALFIYVLDKKFYADNKAIALYSTGIYLTHIFILSILERILKRVSFITISETPKTIIVFLLSVIITFFLIKIQKRFKYIL